jgi:hypothetical protein
VGSLSLHNSLGIFCWGRSLKIQREIKREVLTGVKILSSVHLSKHGLQEEEERTPQKRCWMLQKIKLTQMRCAPAFVWRECKTPTSTTALSLSLSLSLSYLYIPQF